METVAILHYAGPPYVGGVEITMAAHARVLAANGYAVRMLTGKGDATGSSLTQVTIPELASRGALLETIARELAQGQVSATFEALVDQLSTRLAEALLGVKALIVHNVLSLHKNLAFTAALHRLHHSGLLPPMLAWCHDFAWLDPLYMSDLHPGYPWDLLRQPWPGVRYVVVSEDRRGMLAGLLGLDPAEVTVVTPGVDLAAMLHLGPTTMDLVDRLGLLNANPLLLLPARITRRKNIELAITLTGSLQAYGYAPHLVITGPPGPHNPANAAYLAELFAVREASGANVAFLYEAYTDAAGQPLPVSDAMVADLFRLADGLLFPSRYEGFGIPILEAGLVNLPIFCSDIPPLRATAGNAATYFQLDEPPDQIARRMASVFAADPRTALKQRVRTHYTWEAIFHREIAPLLADG
ncbi:hypothetical protein A9Q02_13350 [Candidatus Chloroploca asiatica]|uniref:Glycosyl transferase family 1 domain-containing protein n=1 Tax=Candidatus Chloroploca asiatica TaxID=1506545 RepID=A0A2H3KP54_9CHLR|nr:hypothetical protein A9Q02_13350 [Candidatus Chloroploca asiatica]